MNAQSFKVSCSCGVRFRTCFYFCETGDLVDKSTLSRITYTVYEWDGWSGTRTPVPGHENIEISLDNFLESGTLTDPETGEEYNLSFTISGVTNLPFPNHGKEYEVQITLYDLNSEPSAHSFRCYSTPYV